MVANAIVYYNSAILSRLLEKCKASGNEKALALVTSSSPVASRHVHLNRRYAFLDGGQAIDLDAIIQGLNLDDCGNAEPIHQKAPGPWPLAPFRGDSAGTSL